MRRRFALSQESVGRFSSEWQSQCACRMLADFSILIWPTLFERFLWTTFGDSCRMVRLFRLDVGDFGKINNNRDMQEPASQLD
jgi:hypothetical protein